MLFPLPALSYVSGVDDINSRLSAEQQLQFDTAITTYYQAPSMQKVDTVLDLMTTSEVLRKKTAWAPLIGFFTVVFADNPEHVMGWLSRNNYNSYAIDVIVAALMHAKMKEQALVFAQAEQWSDEEITKLKNTEDTVNLKALTIVVPGHIDTLWGAFFASGDAVYVNEIIAVLFMDHLSASNIPRPEGSNALGENRALAAKTLSYYARADNRVKKILLKKLDDETDARKKESLRRLLP